MCTRGIGVRGAVEVRDGGGWDERAVDRPRVPPCRDDVRDAPLWRRAGILKAIDQLYTHHLQRHVVEMVVIAHGKPRRKASRRRVGPTRQPRISDCAHW